MLPSAEVDAYIRILSVNEKCLMKNEWLDIFGGLVFFESKTEIILKARFTTYFKKSNESVVIYRLQ